MLHFKFKVSFKLSLTYQIDIDFQFPKSIVHNSCIVYNYIQPIKHFYCHLKRLCN